MRVVILYEVFAESMGYAPLCIAKEFARKNVDVHYVTAGLPPNHYIQGFSETYGAFLGAEDRRGTSAFQDGFNIHYLDWRRQYGGIWMKGVKEKLDELKPDIVQTFTHVNWAPLQAAWWQPSIGYRLFTANHTTASVFPLAQRNAPFFDRERILEFARRGIPGRFVSSRAVSCYGATVDCSDVARRFLGVPENKLKTVPLGVDTSVFHPAQNETERAKARILRHELGIAETTVLCVYTGRLSADKNPLLLARAIAELRQAGHDYAALFYGDGEQREAIATQDGSVVRPFVPYTDLGNVYRAADIGVWPTQESTSMLDAAGCGTPIIVNDTIKATERVDGNGVTYRLNSLESLVDALQKLASPEERQRLGAAGALKISSRFSWDALAQVRLDDYRAAMAATSPKR